MKGVVVEQTTTATRVLQCQDLVGKMTAKILLVRCSYRSRVASKSDKKFDNKIL